MIRITDSGEYELIRVKQTVMQNGYLECLIEKSMIIERNKSSFQSVKNKAFLISVPFRGDIITDMLSRRSQVTIHNTYFAAELRILFSSRPVLLLQMKNRLLVDSTPKCLYRFICTCEASYIGQTTRRLSELVEQWTDQEWMTGSYHLPDRIASSNQHKYAINER